MLFSQIKGSIEIKQLFTNTKYKEKEDSGVSDIVFEICCKVDSSESFKSVQQEDNPVACPYSEEQ